MTTQVTHPVAEVPINPYEGFDVTLDLNNTDSSVSSEIMSDEVFMQQLVSALFED
tara:strand:- start:887 stop:1051 length:165 start_codon:yes stop_codon:yes gene_type:complete